MNPENDEQDDAALFRAAIGPVTPLRSPVAPLPSKPRPKPRAGMRQQDEDDALSEFHRILSGKGPMLTADDPLRYRRDTVPLRTWQRLRRGLYAIQDELDLHGANVSQASTLLRQFLNDAKAEELSCVRIIHGKGLSNKDGTMPALKNLVDRLLRQRNDVIAFHSAPDAQGGTGAVLVLLSRR